MKKISTLVTVILLMFGYNSNAGTTVNVTSNTTWNSSPSCTSNCVFNISTGVTLTINTNLTCNTCTFNGGSIIMSKNLTCQPCTFNNNTITINSAALKPNSSTTSFTGVTLTVNGTGDILANTPVNITNSTFTFNGSSYFNNNGGQLNITNSDLYFNGSSYFLANAGPVNLMSSSHVIVGDGTPTSTAYFKMNGPTLNVYDNSAIAIENTHNSYFNWGSYNYYTSTTATTHTSYSNPSAPSYYGTATMNGSGFTSGVILPVTISDFTGRYRNNTVELGWTAEGDINFDHFAIQRSADGNEWQTIGIVDATSSSTAVAYSFNDVSPLDNSSDYRLQMIDVNGKTTYSGVISIATQAANSAVSIFPNPAVNGHFNIKTPSANAISVNIFSMEGRLLYSASLKGQNQYSVDLPSAASLNNYLVVQVISDGKKTAFNILNGK